MLAVEEAGINYSSIAGSSAGAIVAALHASGVPAAEIADTLAGIRKNDFWDSTGISGVLRALARRGRGWTGLLKGELFEKMIEDHLRVKTFEECPRSLYLTAFNLTQGADETFYSGTIADKVRASCSYPFLMSPKNINGQDYWDGGFLAKVPVETLIERENPDRLIVHYLPASSDERSFNDRAWSAMALMERALSVARREIEQHRLSALGDMKQRIKWVETVVPKVSPKDLRAGRAAIEAAYRQGLEKIVNRDTKD